MNTAPETLLDLKYLLREAKQRCVLSQTHHEAKFPLRLGVHRFLAWYPGKNSQLIPTLCSDKQDPSVSRDYRGSQRGTRRQGSRMPELRWSWSHDFKLSKARRHPAQATRLPARISLWRRRWRLLRKVVPAGVPGASSLLPLWYAPFAFSSLALFPHDSWPFLLSSARSFPPSRIPQFPLAIPDVPTECSRPQMPLVVVVAIMKDLSYERKECVQQFLRKQQAKRSFVRLTKVWTALLPRRAWQRQPQPKSRSIAL